MIVRYLPNGSRKVSNLLNMSRMLSATASTAVSGSKGQNALSEMFNPENQLLRM